MEESAADKYLGNRDVFRRKARDEFLVRAPAASSLVDATNELVAGLTLFLSARDLRGITHGFYIGDLIVSFCRTHFIASDLLLQSELIDAAILLRKQMELIGRLHQLGPSADIDTLTGKTPKIGALSATLRRMYPEYSAIAHSSDPRRLELLGTVEADGKVFTPLYPVFLDNSRAALSHLVLIAVEFFSWTKGFYGREFRSYDGERDTAVYERVLTSSLEVFKVESRDG